MTNQQLTENNTKPYSASNEYNKWCWKQSIVQREYERNKGYMSNTESMKRALQVVGEV